jgi:Protein of unknown function (DUF1552)
MSKKASKPEPRQMDRRHFLRGVGGFALAIPFLSSLERRAEAATAIPKRYVAFISDHGGALAADLHPADALLTENTAAGLPHQVRRGVLANGLTVASGVASLSPILSAPSTLLTKPLVGKMNVMRGLVLPFYAGHHRAGHLGNWAVGANGKPTDGLEMLPTIDQVMAYSSAIYAKTPRQRSMTLLDPTRSWNYQNPTAKTGPIGMVSAWTSSIALFKQIYSAPTTGGRGPVINHVLEDYKRLRANNRLSAQDRERLDAHIASVADLEAALNAPLACGTQTVPTMDSQKFINSDINKAYQLMLDVVAVAFSCDTSRVAVIPLNTRFSGYAAGDYHADIAHQAGNLVASKPTPPRTPREWQTLGYQHAFENGFLYLAKKLDSLAEGTGAKVLDHSLLTWVHEAGTYTHQAYDLPVITAGGAGGALKTGSYLDYRNLGLMAKDNTDRAGMQPSYYGLTWHQYLGSVLKTMGVPKTDYKAGNSHGGYGIVQDAAPFYGDTAKFVPALNVADNLLPYW